MKKLITVALSLMLMVGLSCVAIAGSIEPSGPPTSGSGMYTLQNLYDYLTSGAALTVQTSFQEPTSVPGSTMKSTKEIGDAVATPFAQCASTTAANVESGKKFFSTASGSWGVKTGTYAPYKTVLKTGQTSIYLSGDDGSYHKGIVASYTDGISPYDGSVTDNVTGLIWAKNGNGEGCTNLDWTSAINWAEGLSFAGSSDWRLPNITEIQTLLVRDAGQECPFVNKTMFPNTKADYYWSSTTNTSNTGYALCADFSDGFLPNVYKTKSYCVRVVRGGE